MTASAKRLCAMLRTTPQFLFDPLLHAVGAGWCVDPSLVENLMASRGEFDDSLSIRDNVVRVYGEDAARLMEECF